MLQHSLPELLKYWGNHKHEIRAALKGERIENYTHETYTRETYDGGYIELGPIGVVVASLVILALWAFAIYALITKWREMGRYGNIVTIIFMVLLMAGALWTPWTGIGAITVILMVFGFSQLGPWGPPQ